MKILKILFVSIAVLIAVLFIAAVIFIKTFDLNRFKPQIISQASKTLNRRVDFEKINLALSLRQGISLKISNLVIAEDPAFGKGDFLAVKGISLAVDVLKYIFNKEVNVPNVLIDSPRVAIIRKKDGSLNVQTIAQSSQSEKEGVKPAPVSAPLVMPAILISSVKGGNGLVMFLDYSFEPPLSLEISDLGFSLSKISLTEAFPFTVEAAVLSAKRNIKLEGKAQVDLKTNEVVISELKGTTELSDIILEKIPAAFPMTKGAVLPASLKGKVEVLLKNLTAGPKGLTALTADAALTNGALRFKEMASPVKDVKINMNITEKKIILNNASLAIGEGVINASGLIDDYLAKQEYRLEADAENLKIQDLIAQGESPVKAEGLASGKIKFKGRGFSPEALKSSLSGAVDISVIQAKLKDINVLRTVLDKISVIPGLAQKVEAGLPERFKQKLTQADTALSDIKLPVTVESGRLVVRGASLGADEFMFKGGGEAGFDSAYSLEGSFFIPQEISASMVAQVPELQYLLNEDKQIYVPLKISGKAGNPKFQVDAEYIAKRLIADQAKQQLFKVIEKAIGTKEQTPNATEQNAPAIKQDTPQDDSKKKSATEDLVDSIIGNIFKK